jgi:gliding motility-associated-like protein
VRYFFLVITVLFPLITAAQLSAPGASAVRHTAVNDPVFIYCNASGSQKGTISAVCPRGTGPFNFSWYIWSDATKSFSVSLKNEPGVMNSSVNNLAEGGYKVQISGGYDTSLIAWIFIDKPYALAELKNRTCDYVALKGKALIDTFYYRNLSTGVPVILSNKVKYLWSSDPTSTIPFPDLTLFPQTFDPPLVDVVYKLQVSDSFGCRSESSFPYETIAVKADFSADPVKGEAPLTVTFTDKSIRGSLYNWEFFDHSQDSISILSNPEPHIYYKPGEYAPKLTIVSDKGCIDSLRLNPKIVVDPSKLNVPNVFTPDGDGINDYFMVESKSLKYLSVEVFSRSGMKVFAFFGEGESLRAWKGWDGNINTSSIKASPGVYFYIIHAIGWDDIDYSSKEYRGTVYLYR